MYDHRRFYIDGAWRDPQTPNEFDVVNPATELPIGKISLGAAGDVDRAVRAARAAFESYSRSPRQARVELLERIHDIIEDAEDRFFLLGLDRHAQVEVMDHGSGRMKSTWRRLRNITITME